MRTDQDLDALLDRIRQRAMRYRGRGRVANYIPALAKIDPAKFGFAIARQGVVTGTGDMDEPFSIQSMSKLFTLTIVLANVGDQLWRRVGREPSGNPFNSLVQLEREQGIPRNPFINAGALVVADLLLSTCQDAKGELLAFIRTLAGDETIGFDEEVARSEAKHGFINRALANFLKGWNNLDNDVEEVLDLYFHHCSIAMSCRQLVQAAGPLANAGVCPRTGRRILSRRRTKRINAMMMTCGLYDAVGDFAFRVGLPAKSGVGGGIVAVLPGRFTAAVWSPELDASGNSLAGVASLEYLTEELECSVFNES